MLAAGSDEAPCRPFLGIIRKRLRDCHCAAAQRPGVERSTWVGPMRPGADAFELDMTKA